MDTKYQIHINTSALNSDGYDHNLPQLHHVHYPLHHSIFWRLESGGLGSEPFRLRDVPASVSTCDEES